MEGRVDRRKGPRVAVELPVRVWGIDAYDCAFSQVVSATNISQQGALLDSMKRRLRMGDIVEVQYGSRIAEFRVVWTRDGAHGQPEQVGVKILLASECIWDGYLERCCEFVGSG
jgi:hypothetical protein